MIACSGYCCVLCIVVSSAWGGNTPGVVMDVLVVWVTGRGQGFSNGLWSKVSLNWGYCGSRSVR